MIVEHRLESRHLRIHNQDVGRDARLTQLRTLVSHRHSQIVHALVFERLGYFERPCPVCRSLDHTNHLGFRLKFVAIIVQVVNQSVQIDFQNGFMHFQFQQIGNFIEMESSCPFNQHHLIAQRVQQPGFQQLCRGAEKMLFDVEAIGRSRDFLSHSDDVVYPPAMRQISYLLVKLFAGLSAFKHIRKD